MPQWGRRITDKLDAFCLGCALFVLLGAYWLPLTVEQKQTAGGLLLLILGFIMRRWTASLRSANHKPEGE